MYYIKHDIKTAPSKKAFQNFSFKKYFNIALSKNALQKNIPKWLPQKMYFKNTCQIAPSKKIHFKTAIN